MGCNDDADGPVYSGKFLNRRDIIHITQSRSAVFDREDDPHQAHSPELSDNLSREFTGLVPAHDIRCDFPLSKITDFFAQLLLLLSKGKRISPGRWLNDFCFFYRHDGSYTA